MLELIKKNKITVGVLAVLLVGVLVYQFTVGGEDRRGQVTRQSGGQATTTAPTGPGEEAQLLMQRLERISVNSALFERPTFQRLEPFGYEVTPIATGRTDPFAPLSQRSGSNLR